jgi:tRNA pseudouridine38-40 synthase
VSTVRLRVDLAYDGTGFRGWARQKGDHVRTVQQVVEQALATLAGAPVVSVAAGRTDAGVHAEHQVVHCDVPHASRLVQDFERARGALDALCGSEVTVWRVRRVPASFDARFSATQRRYRYRLCDAPAASPLERHRTWHVQPPRLDVGAMQAGGEQLVGEHDFSSFCRRAGSQHLVRRIDALLGRRRSAALVTVDVGGKAFCHQMIRSIVACLVRVGRGLRPPEWVAEVLAARDRQAVGDIAPPHGLTLTAISYSRRGA